MIENVSLIRIFIGSLALVIYIIYLKVEADYFNRFLNSPISAFWKFYLDICFRCPIFGFLNCPTTDNVMEPNAAPLIYEPCSLSSFGGFYSGLPLAKILQD